jgi:hypothetical protein
LKYQFVPLLIFFASMLVPIGVALWVRFQRRKRRSPLTVQLLRAPGESLSKEIEKLTADVDSYLSILTMLPLIVFSMYLSVKYLGSQQASWQIMMGLGIIALVPCAYKLIKLLNRRLNLCLGLDCERAVGQELDQLMLDGYRVYHDFPADDFNIDHIVIGKNGVFAVETKGRAKPAQGDVTITYDGEGLQFPTHYETVSRLSRQKGRPTGCQNGFPVLLVISVAVIAGSWYYPGWYIERKKPRRYACLQWKEPAAGL